MRLSPRAVAVVATILVFGGLSASAATLGGLSSQSLGADQNVVASCDSDGVGIAYTTTYVAASGGYKVTDVVLSGVNAACDTKSYKLTLADGSGTSLDEEIGTVSLVGTSQTIHLVTAVPAGSVLKAALTITG